MSIDMTRRTLLRLAGAATLSAAAAAAARAEGLDGSDTPMFAVTRPVHVGDVTLRVRNIEQMTAYYRAVLGFELTGEDAGNVRLGAGGVTLLTLEHRPDARLEPRNAAGLYHTAFLMPSRLDLARWLVHAAMMGVPMTGFADHRVSEAVYLDDPEGNGIEVYADRPEDGWLWVAGRVTMGTEPIDFDSLLALADTTTDTYAAVPEGLRIGHIHLRAGDIAGARQFYNAALGLDITAEMPTALFLASGGYHHHVALNVWESAGAGQRDAQTTGLARFSLTLEDQQLLTARQTQLAEAGIAIEEIANGIAAVDPWGTRIELLTA